MHRLRVYLGYFRDAGKVLDVGCGRGELVELLEDEGVPVWGVDANADAANYCGSRGLPVTRADAAAYLDEQADGSLGGIFLGRAAGRTTPADLAALLRRCRVKLRRGGVLVVESVNPACPEAPAEAPGEPSRAWPLPLLRSLLEGEGFGPTEVVFSGPVSAGLPPVARGADEVPPRASAYHTYAVAGRS
jgi:O-antigen chain-terminating methyltransferase